MTRNPHNSISDSFCPSEPQAVSRLPSWSPGLDPLLWANVLPVSSRPSASGLAFLQEQGTGAAAWESQGATRLEGAEGPRCPWRPLSSPLCHLGTAPALGLSVPWKFLEVEDESSRSGVGNQTWKLVNVKLYNRANRRTSGNQSWEWNRWTCFKTIIFGSFLMAKD